MKALPRVVVYSERRLHITARGVHETPLGGDPPSYRYRYDGLRFLVRSQEKYFLLPEEWTDVDGVAIVLPDSEGFRYEFAR